MVDLLPYIVWIAAGSALGGVARFALSGLVAERFGGAFPWGTLVVNASGALAIGVTAAAMPPGGLSPVLWHALVTGFLGSYTTVSSFSLQTLDLLLAGDGRRALANVAASLGLCLAGAATGLALGGMAFGWAG